VLLQLLAQGIKDIVHFPWLTKPSAKTLKSALELLLMLGALNERQELTPYGLLMSKLPLHPSHSHLLLSSRTLHCMSEALTAVALLSAENVFLQPHQEKDKLKAVAAHKAFSSSDGDLCTMINIYNSWIQVMS
jgi:HrpA-like RNA helicase